MLAAEVLTATRRIHTVTISRASKRWSRPQPADPCPCHDPSYRFDATAQSTLTRVWVRTASSPKETAAAMPSQIVPLIHAYPSRCPTS
jgi:hypothetical protein